MTKELEMTLIEADMVQRTHSGESARMKTFAKGFLAGHAAASKEAEVYKEALKKTVQPTGCNTATFLRFVMKSCPKGGRCEHPRRL